MDKSYSKLTQDIAKLMKDIADTLKNADKLPKTIHSGGWRMPEGWSLDCIHYAMNDWQVPENSVIISSFPKTGTMWCMEIVRQILYGNDDELLKKSNIIPQLGLNLEFGPVYKFADIYPHLPIPRKLFFTHLPAELINMEKIEESNSKIICMYRNPKDQAVSLYHFAQKIWSLSNNEREAERLGRDWNKFIACYIAGKHELAVKEGEWYPDHLAYWIRRARLHEDSILPVEYESLKGNFKREALRIAKFLDVELSEKDVARVNKRCTIDSMRNKANADNDQSGFMQMNVRKGEVGGWKHQFTVAESEHVDRLVEEKFADIGVKFTYEI